MAEFTLGLTKKSVIAGLTREPLYAYKVLSAIRRQVPSIGKDQTIPDVG